MDLGDRQQRHRVRGDGPFLPADQALYELALLVGVVLRRDHLSQSKGSHYLSDPDRRKVRGRLADPRAIGGIQGDPASSDQRLSIPDLRDRLLHELEGVVGDPLLRAVAQDETAI